MNSDSKPQRLKKISEVFFLIILAILLSACHTEPNINGRWRSESPSALLYEYKDDGTVFLINDGKTYQVFRFQFIDDDSIRLYDGMGRIQVYHLRLTADEMTFYTNLKSGEIAESFQRAN